MRRQKGAAGTAGRSCYAGDTGTAGRSCHQAALAPAGRSLLLRRHRDRMQRVADQLLLGLYRQIAEGDNPD